MACEKFRASVIKMANTAKLVATCSVLDNCGSLDPKLRKEICHNAKLVCYLGVLYSNNLFVLYYCRLSIWLKELLMLPSMFSLVNLIL